MRSTGIKNLSVAVPIRVHIASALGSMRAKKPEILVTFLILLISLANTAGAYQVTLVGNSTGNIGFKGDLADENVYSFSVPYASKPLTALIPAELAALSDVGGAYVNVGGANKNDQAVYVNFTLYDIGEIHSVDYVNIRTRTKVDSSDTTQMGLLNTNGYWVKLNGSSTVGDWVDLTYNVSSAADKTTYITNTTNYINFSLMFWSNGGSSSTNTYSDYFEALVSYTGTPDLLPTAIKPYHYVWTGYATGNDPFFNLTNYVNVTVNNTGSGDASGFKVRLYADDELIGEKIISLAAGSSTDVKFEWKPTGEDPMSWVDTPDGSKITYTTTDRTYNLKAAVDEANEVPEVNETNNNLTRSDSRTKVVWNGYTGDEPLQNYIKGNVKGGMLYSTGDGQYQSVDSIGTTYGTYYNVTYNLEIPGTPELSRLYIYYNWAQSAASPHEAPKMGVTLTTPSGTHTLSMDKGYNDYKGEFGSTYRYPWGTYAYNITAYVTESGNYKVSITNLNDGSDTEFATKYAFAAPAILVVYENTSMPLREYWINEGADILLGGRRSDGGYIAWWEAMNNATFPGSAGLNNAILGIVSPWADSVTDDEVYFNDHSLGRGIYCGYTVPCTQEKDGLKMVLGSGSQVSINASDVTSYLAASSNRLSQADDGDNMMPANAFLLVEVAEVPDFSISVSPNSASVVQGSSASATVTLTSILGYDENVTLSASGIPANANISFTPEKGKPTFTSAMLVNTSNTTPAGSYPITITGTGDDGKVRSTIFTLTVTTTRPGANASVSLKTNIIPAIAIEVTPSSMDFGELAPGETSSGNNLTVKNKGSFSISVTAEVTDNAENLFVDGMLLNDKLWNLYSAVIPKSGDDKPVAKLHVPEEYAGVGSKEGTLMFWASKA